ncbi:hypothetical protein TcG_08310 [Trypanosoma cruzi]|nr:hypothetical protein TcG_08310 [Trypanosoma cruzi]
MGCATEYSTDSLRYYYEDGRGNKVWVQNLTLDHAARRLDCKSRRNGGLKDLHKDPYGTFIPPLHKRPLLHHKTSPARKVASVCDRVVFASANTQRVKKKSFLRRIETSAIRCTCSCPVHSGLAREPADPYFNWNEGEGLNWTFLPETSFKGVIRTVDDAEFLLEKLRSEEHILRKAYVR